MAARRRADPSQSSSTSDRAQRGTAGHLRHLHRADRANAERDFGEVLALNRSFRIYDPRPGPDGEPLVLRERDHSRESHQPDLEEHPGALPGPNNPGTNNGLQNNRTFRAIPKADRDNYDVKVNWNRTTSHQIWGKFSMMQASVFDLFYLPFDAAAAAIRDADLHRRPDVTLSPTLLLDGNVGVNGMQQDFRGPDYGTNYGSEVFGIPASTPTPRAAGSFDLNRYSGMPQFETGLSSSATTRRGRRSGATSAATRCRPT